MRALVIEDDEAIARLNQRLLEAEGFVVSITDTEAEGKRLALSIGYDMIVADLMLPDGSGMNVLKAVRETGSTIPILVVSGVDDIKSTVAALDAGADDYINKPYAFQEFKARVRALMRRDQPGPARISCGNIVLDRMTRVAAVDGNRLNLTVKECALLEYFMINSGRVIPRRELLEKVWSLDFDTGTNIIDVNIARLRGKLTSLGAPGRIKAKRGVGYLFNES